MDYSKKTSLKITTTIFAFFVVAALTLVVILLATTTLFDSSIVAYAVTTVIVVGVLAVLSLVLTKKVYEPLKKLSDVIVYAAHSNRGGAAPDTEQLKIGRELITSLALQIYDVASSAQERSRTSCWCNWINPTDGRYK